MNKYTLYALDTETTGLDFVKNDILEISLYRLSDDNQKTWCLKPLNFETIESAALRINGHKLEDITHKTSIGRSTYLEPSKVIVDIENWIMEDNSSAENRVLIGHNIGFDKYFIESLWKKCNSFDSFPFGRRTMDTMIWAFMMDYAQENVSEGYSLNNLTKKYGVKNEKAHSAAADTKATKEVFEKQVEELKKKLNIK